jgi:hypothetical protein
MILELLFLAAAYLVGQRPNYDELGTRIVPLNDVDGDHCADFALDDGKGHAWVVSGKTGKVVARLEDDPPVGERVLLGPLFGDVSGDGAWDVIDCHADRDIVLRSGKDLRIVMHLPLPKGQDGYIGIPVAAGDWNKDGVPDVAAAVTHDRLTSIVILSGKDGSVLQSIGGDAEWSKGLYVHRNRLVIQSSCRAGDMGRATFVLPTGSAMGIGLIPRDATDVTVGLDFCDQSLWLNAGTGFVGDLDGDGCPDFVIRTFTELSNTQMPLWSKRGTEERHNRDCVGRVVLISGRTGDPIEVLPSGDWDSYEGLAATRIGDLDGDGVDEILLSQVADFGQALILSGKDHRILLRIAENRDCCAGTCRFGASVAALGDVDGDGVSDFAITSSSGVDALDPGCVGIYSGKTRKLLRTIWRADLVPKSVPANESEKHK